MIHFRFSRVRWALILGFVISFHGMVQGAAPQDDSSVSSLINALQNGDPDQKQHAVQALGKLGSKAEAAIPALRKALNDESLYVSMGAAQALAHMGAAAT